jgi:hypothetical protein
MNIFIIPCNSHWNMRNDLRTFHLKSSILRINRTIEVIQTKRQPSMIVQSSPRKHEWGRGRLASWGRLQWRPRTPSTWVWSHVDGIIFWNLVNLVRRSIILSPLSQCLPSPCDKPFLSRASHSTRVTAFRTDVFSLPFTHIFFGMFINVIIVFLKNIFYS